MANPSPRQMVTCPYNKAHQIEHYRMHIHLQKCRLQYPNTPKTTCTFDATHVVNDIELDYHMLICNKRDVFDNARYAFGDDHRPVVPVQPAPQNIVSEENWDDDDYVSYVPDQSKRTDIIKKVKGATPSQRRKARMEGVKTYRPKQHDDAGEGSSGNQGGSAGSSSES